MQRRTEGEVDRRQRQHRAAPAQRADQPGRERYEDRAGQAAQKGHGDDGAAEIERKTPRDHGKNGRVERGRHAHAEQDPHPIKTSQAADRGVQRQAQSQQHRTGCHDRPFMPFVDEPPYRKRQQAVGKQAKAEGQRRFNPAQAHLALHRPHHQREQVKHAAPADQLRKGEPANEAAVMTGDTIHAALLFSGKMLTTMLIIGSNRRCQRKF